MLFWWFYNLNSNPRLAVGKTSRNIKTNPLYVPKSDFQNTRFSKSLDCTF